MVISEDERILMAFNKLLLTRTTRCLTVKNFHGNIMISDENIICNTNHVNQAAAVHAENYLKKIIKRDCRSSSRATVPTEAMREATKPLQIGVKKVVIQGYKPGRLLYSAFCYGYIMEMTTKSHPSMIGTKLWTGIADHSGEIRETVNMKSRQTISTKTSQERPIYEIIRLLTAMLGEPQWFRFQRWEPWITKSCVHTYSVTNVMLSSCRKRKQSPNRSRRKNLKACYISSARWFLKPILPMLRVL